VSEPQATRILAADHGLNRDPKIAALPTLYYMPVQNFIPRRYWKGRAVKLHMSTMPLLRMFAAFYIVMSVSLDAKAAEIWSDSAAAKSDALVSEEARSCPLIIHNCEICVTAVGTGEVVCTQRAEECVPTEWMCFNGIGTGEGSGKRYLSFASTQAGSAVSGAAAAPKLIRDRLPQVETADEPSVRVDFQQPNSMQSTSLPSRKQIYDRLNPSD
jgi:hypothetical protein